VVVAGALAVSGAVLGELSGADGPVVPALPEVPAVLTGVALGVAVCVVAACFVGFDFFFVGPGEPVRVARSPPLDVRPAFSGAVLDAAVVEAAVEVEADSLPGPAEPLPARAMPPTVRPAAAAAASDTRATRGESEPKLSVIAVSPYGCP
jgi:hypothetical protein